ncbi:MAG: hypothetical protein ACTS73_05685 [Arsenophonus sp. NEOnobi-MAG3]
MISSKLMPENIYYINGDHSNTIPLLKNNGGQNRLNIIRKARNAEFSNWILRIAMILIQMNV